MIAKKILREESLICTHDTRRALVGCAIFNPCFALQLHHMVELESANLQELDNLRQHIIKVVSRLRFQLNVSHLLSSSTNINRISESLSVNKEIYLVPTATHHSISNSIKQSQTFISYHS
jgi:hypothetical protein